MLNLSASISMALAGRFLQRDTVITPRVPWKEELQKRFGSFTLSGPWVTDKVHFYWNFWSSFISFERQNKPKGEGGRYKGDKSKERWTYKHSTRHAKLDREKRGRIFSRVIPPITALSEMCQGMPDGRHEPALPSGGLSTNCFTRGSRDWEAACKSRPWRLPNNFSRALLITWDFPSRWLYELWLTACKAMQSALEWHSPEEVGSSIRGPDVYSGSSTIY